jgi:hypothetical protein
MNKEPLMTDEQVYREICTMLDATAGNPGQLRDIVESVRWQITKLEESVFEGSIEEKNLKIGRAIEGLRNLNLKIERVRDDIMMATTAANFFSLKYKDHIRFKKKDDE